MTWLTTLVFALSCGYLVFSTWLALRFQQKAKELKPSSAVSSLRFCQVKPLYNYDSHTLRSIETFLNQEGVPRHEIYLCSRHKPYHEWLEKNPTAVWLQIQADQSRNGKAATLAQAERYWTGDIFVVSDADMRARPDHLHRVLAEFEDPKVGVVTCLYRAAPPRFGCWGGLFESLCIGDFAASVLVARRTEGMGFAMGSTMAVRREVLDKLGGFAALEPYLADDFQLGYRARRAGWRVSLASTILETPFPGLAFRDALSHQYRWLVTSRVSRPGGHAAFVITQGLLWALLTAVWNPSLGLGLLAFWCWLRVVTGQITSRALEVAARPWWECLFLPWKDGLYLVLWAKSLRGNTVRWGDRTLEIDREGQIVSSTT